MGQHKSKRRPQLLGMCVLARGSCCFWDLNIRLWRCCCCQRHHVDLGSCPRVSVITPHPPLYPFSSEPALRIDFSVSGWLVAHSRFVARQNMAAKPAIPRLTALRIYRHLYKWHVRPQMHGIAASLNRLEQGLANVP